MGGRALGQGAPGRETSGELGCEVLEAGRDRAGPLVMDLVCRG